MSMEQARPRKGPHPSLDSRMSALQAKAEILTLYFDHLAFNLPRWSRAELPPRQSNHELQ